MSEVIRGRWEDRDGEGKREEILDVTNLEKSSPSSLSRKVKVAVQKRNG